MEADPQVLQRRVVELEDELDQAKAEVSFRSYLQLGHRRVIIFATLPCYPATLAWRYAVTVFRVLVTYCSLTVYELFWS